MEHTRFTFSTKESCEKGNVISADSILCLTFNSKVEDILVALPLQ